MIRTLIVDDSATMRSLIAAKLSEDPAIAVVGQAADPHEAREAIKALSPDVITLDVEMPNMNGLDFLERLMRLRPTPVVMISTLTSRGAETALRALELGAVDCVGKPSAAGANGFSELAEKVKLAARARLRPAHERAAAAAAAAAPPAPSSRPYQPDGRIVAIGASTGGVEALIAVLSGYPPNGPPTVITQHMPPVFTRSFAERLNRLSATRVAEATDGTPLAVGHVYLAPGGPAHLEVTGHGPLRCRLRAGDPVNGHRPSVDVLFNSVARHAAGRAVGVILTGMGSDGAAGLRAMRAAGAATIAQDEASCVVFGMPKAALAVGAADRPTPLARVAATILAMTDASARKATS